ncbi:hypothetical protein [Streptomyces pseudovenezuelae]|uniref:hypothetical protein n=1 Tax=Streptomyces pseudovenezuelae TaxID=67350 RepID=UPI002E3316B3|nr:hypothetical protein [Streptomyces pseudovenezuelae]
MLLYTVVTALRTPVADPERVADVAEELVRYRRLPDVEYQEEWEGARAMRAAADDFRRSRLGLGPRLPQDGAGSASGSGPGVQLTIDTQADTYEQAVAALRAAYGGEVPPAPLCDPDSEAATIDGGRQALQRLPC